MDYSRRILQKYMKFIKTYINDLIIIQLELIRDNRGAFCEYYNAEKFKKNGIYDTFPQSNMSVSHKGVLRGLHLQSAPHEQGKLVRAIKGSILDVAVDLRKDSLTFGKHFSIELTKENMKSLYIPAGFAHGFLSLEDDTMVSYHCTNLYQKDHEKTILWNDEELNINWGIDNPILSEKDRKGIKLEGLR